MAGRSDQHGHGFLSQLNSASMAVVWGFLLALTAACSARPYLNEPLTELPASRGESMARQAAGDRAPELLVLLAFSGGGTRAASLAYGVLQELAATTVVTSRGERRLLDEVDVVSSVSGGSFVSAYFGLFGDRIFDDFEQRFLRRAVQTDLAAMTSDPQNWFKQASPYLGRSDLATHYYDQILFENRTMKDLFDGSGPFVIINSTDIGTGARFAFVHAMFDLLCSDLDSFPVSRAVMASVAAPVAATPISLRNYAGNCGYRLPDPQGFSLQEVGISVRRAKAESFYEYFDADRHPWLYLADGGIADNLALRAFFSFFSPLDDPPRTFDAFGHPQVRHVLIISVNAELRQQRQWSPEGKLPSWAEVVIGWTNIQLERDAADTIYIVRKNYQDWVAQLSRSKGPVSFDFAEVSLAVLSDPAERAYLTDLPTSLELGDEQVDRLIAAGRRLLRDSPDFRRFLDAAAADVQ